MISNFVAEIFSSDTDYSVFSINIMLTEYGFENIDQVLTAYQQYINLIKSRGVNADRFEQEKLVNKKNKKNQKSPLVSFFRKILHFYDFFIYVDVGKNFSALRASLVMKVMKVFRHRKIGVGNFFFYYKKTFS